MRYKSKFITAALAASAASAWSLGFESVVAGDASNTANGDLAAAVGGAANSASGTVSAVIGGAQNTAAAVGAAAVGGANNKANGAVSFAGGGLYNTVGGYGASLGGSQNNVSGVVGAAVGGQFNTVSGYGAVALGGIGNTASGIASIAGGRGAVASGAYTIALGRNAVASAAGSVIIADGSATGVSNVTVPNQVQIRAAGGIFFDGVTTPRVEDVTVAGTGVTSATVTAPTPANVLILTNTSPAGSPGALHITNLLPVPPRGTRVTLLVSAASTGAIDLVGGSATPGGFLFDIDLTGLGIGLDFISDGDKYVYTQ